MSAGQHGGRHHRAEREVILIPYPRMTDFLNCLIDAHLPLFGGHRSLRSVDSDAGPEGSSHRGVVPRLFSLPPEGDERSPRLMEGCGVH